MQAILWGAAIGLFTLGLGMSRDWSPKKGFLITFYSCVAGAIVLSISPPLAAVICLVMAQFAVGAAIGSFFAGAEIHWNWPKRRTIIGAIVALIIWSFIFNGYF